jgi:uncharacterized protein YegL
MENKMNGSLLELDDLVDNPTPRVPVSLCLDCSGSMMGNPIAELNKGVVAFYEALYEDEVARYSAEISIVTFGPARLETKFQTLDTNNRPPCLAANGNTPLGEAVKLSLDSLEERKLEYQRNGVDYYQPWLVLMTDGIPCGGDTGLLQAQIERVRDLVASRKLVLFPIGIGSQAPMSILAQFSPGRTPLKLKGLNFNNFFAWLSKSVSRVSQSTVGDKVSLDSEGIKGWAEI